MRKVAFLVLAAAASFAGETRYWELSRRDHFMDCEEAANLIVDNDGRLRVGPETRVVRLQNEASAWSACFDSRGRLLVGAGSGRIYRISDTGFEIEYDTGELLVTSLVAVGELVYAGTLPNGKVFRRGPDGKWAELVKLESPNVWALGAAADGTVYAAGGKPARVFRILPGGQAATVFESEAEHVYTLDVISRDELLIGTAAPAHLIRLKKRKGTVLFDFGDGEVRAVLRRGDTIYAAVNQKIGMFPHEALKALTPRGAIKPGQDKKEEYLFDPIIVLSDPITGKWEGKVTIDDLGVEANVTVQLKNDNGRVTGTVSSDISEEKLEVKGTWDKDAGKLTFEGEAQGATFKIEAKLTAEDQLEGEVTLEFEGNTVKGKLELRRTEKPKEVEKPVERPAQKPPEPPQQPPAQQPPQAPKPPEMRGLSGPVKSSVWRLTPSHSEPVLDFNAYLTALAPAVDGVFVATNFSGRVYKVLDSRGYELWFDTRENAVAGFAVQEGRLRALLLADKGRVALIGDKPAAKGIYVTRFFDTRFVSHWGQLTVTASGPLEARTRTGNVAMRDDLYSDWSEPLVKFPAKITSPKGRYLQVKLTLTDPKTVVESLSVAYKNENQRPRVSDVRVDYVPLPQPGEPPPAPAQPGGSGPRVGQPHSSLKRISWAAQDPDGDVLVFRIFYRPEDGTVWVPLTPDPVPINQFQWTTESVPDGKYILRVSASDERSNLKEEALEGDFETGTVIVDNTAPVVKLDEPKGATITGVATDRTSNIARLEYQVDGGEWKTVLCKDGVFDAPRETFEIKLAGLGPGKHVVYVRAFDQEMNQGVAGVSVTVK